LTYEGVVDGSCTMLASCIHGEEIQLATASATSVHQPPNPEWRKRFLAPSPGCSSARPGRCSVVDVDGTVTLVSGGLTVRVVRHDRCADPVEALELVGRELDECGAQVVGELVGVARAQDH
jgi:hypothetical protein